MASYYPSFTSLLARSSAGDFDDLFDDETLIKPGYISHADAANLTSTYLWKIDNAALVMKNRSGLTGSLFKGPSDTVWRLHLHWGSAAKDPKSRHLHVRLSYVGNIANQLRIQAGYEVFKGDSEFRRGMVDLDGSTYCLRNDAGEGNYQSVEWVHHKDLGVMMNSSVVPGGALLVGVKIKVVVSQGMGLRSRPSEIAGQWDMELTGKDGGKVRVHRADLAEWSPALGAVCENLDNQTFAKFDSVTLEAVVELLYTGDFTESSLEGHGCQLLEFVLKYEITDVCERVCEYLARNLWREGIFRIFLLTDGAAHHPECDTLRRHAAAVIHRNLHDVFNGADLPDDVIKVIKSRVSELDKIA